MRTHNKRSALNFDFVDTAVDQPGPHAAHRSLGSCRDGHRRNRCRSYLSPRKWIVPTGAKHDKLQLFSSVDRRHVVDSLKVLDLNWPIREADKHCRGWDDRAPLEASPSDL